MPNITFVTGNQKKADYMARYFGHPIDHIKLDLDEIQSTNLKEIVEHKIRQAYDKIQKPVIVEDVSLEFEALGWLPWPFIKFFMESVAPETICGMIHGLTRKATSRCVFAYFDGTVLKFFEGKLEGQIAETPAGGNGFGWDPIFIPDGYTTTRACLSEEDDQKTYLQLKPFAQLKVYLESRE